MCLYVKFLKNWLTVFTQNSNLSYLTTGKNSFGKNSVRKPDNMTLLQYCRIEISLRLRTENLTRIKNRV